MIEITREEYLQQMNSSSQRAGGVGSRLSKLVKGRLAKSNNGNIASSSTANSRDHNINPRPRSSAPPSSLLRDAASVASQSIEGIQSQTSSLDTVKASNTKEDEYQQRHAKGDSSKKKGKWNKLKRMIGVKTAPTDEHVHSSNSLHLSSTHTHNAFSKITNTSATKRCRSATSSQEKIIIMDDTIRGRYDGVNVLGLGGAQHVSSVLHPSYPDSLQFPEEFHDWPRHSFIGESFLLSPAELVTKTLQYEIMLDGFAPGTDDRWCVRLEQRHPAVSSNNTADTVTTNATAISTESSDEDGSAKGSSQQLWNSLWGSGPIPTTMRDSFRRGHASDDPVLALAAECAVPIDVDEDTFMISTREHYNAILEIASMQLAEQGNLDLALGVFDKVVRGLDASTQYKFLKGTTLHNSAMVHLCKGDYSAALECFTRAVEERRLNLPKNHPDTTVSMIWKGSVLFALKRFEESIAALEVALSSTPNGHIVKGKIRNNLGVVYYHLNDFASTMRELTASLEIQRTWLDTSGRREPFVQGAATTLSNMGRIYLEQGNAKSACEVYEEALLLQTTIFRKDTEDVMQSLLNLSIGHARAGHSKKALQILHGCVRSTNQRYGPMSASSMELIGLMGYLYMKRNDFTDSSKCLTNVKMWQKDHLVEHHPAVEQTKDMLATMGEVISKGDKLWV